MRKWRVYCSTEATNVFTTTTIMPTQCPNNVAHTIVFNSRSIVDTHSAAGSLFGTGADGDVTITSGTTTLSRDMYYRNLVITASGILKPNGYRIFVADTLSLAGSINDNGNSATSGSAATAMHSAVILGTGSPAASGGIAMTTGSNAPAQAAGTLMGGIGGAGGSSGLGTRAGGIAGTGSQPSAANGGINAWRIPGVAVRGRSLRSLTTILNGGTGGGGGGGGNTTFGGGSGTGGGVVIVSAYAITVSGGTITASGGNGFTPTISAMTGAGGGGGGGGGVVVIITVTDLSASMSSFSANGGIGGSGGPGTVPGSSGASGNNGTVWILDNLALNAT